MNIGWPSSRRWPLLVATVWVGIDLLLLRIAAGAGFTDWAHTYSEKPKLFVAILFTVVIDLVVAGLVVAHPARRVLLASVAWGALVAVFGIVLLVRGNDTSGSAISVGAVAAAWLAYRAVVASATGK